MSQTERQKFFLERVPIYQMDPERFGFEVCGFKADPWQSETFADLAVHNRISVRSGHGVGKTAFESICVLWFLSCFKFPKIVCTAPTMQQLHDVLWSEVDKWRSNSALLEEMTTWTKTYLYFNGYAKRWFAVAKTASRPENMQGFHEENMLFIADEASGIEDDIMEAILATLSGANNKLLMCGNPTRTSGTFYDSHNRDRALYKCHKVSSLDSARTNKESIELFIRKYGKDSNAVRVRVDGDFPTQEDDVFISLSSVEAAIVNELPENPKPTSISFGVDVARYGDDSTVISKNVDGKITIPCKRHGQDTMATVGDIVRQYNFVLDEYPRYKGNVVVTIDDTGLGGGVTDRLNELKREGKIPRMTIVPANFGSKIEDEKADKFYSGFSTWIWSIVRDLLEEKLLQFPNDEDLVAQFSTRKYVITSSGKIELEKKDDMKKRGLVSPDIADSVALSCYKKKMFALQNLT